MPRPPTLDHFLFQEARTALDRYAALLDEDQALRDSEYKTPDPRRRRLRIACNECTTPGCCNQRVDVEFVEALVLYRWAAEHAPRQLADAVKRGEALHAGPQLTDTDFFRRRVPCAFLVKGQCVVYPVRPYACRAHYMAGNPSKCRTELQPTDTYEMNPDNALIREIESTAEDVRFELLVEGCEPRELSEVLALIDRLVHKAARWRAPRMLRWRDAEPRTP
jgi:Fe-S-cluster containining protein